MASNAPTVAKEIYLAQAGFRDLPKGWDIVQIEELLSEDRGISVGVMYPGNHDPLGIPLIKAGDMSGCLINPNPEFRMTPEKHHEYRRTAFAGGEILMTLVGEIGQCAIVPPHMAGWNAARAVAVIRIADPTDAFYVRLCLLSRPIRHLMDVWANTTVQPTLNLKEIRQLPLPWPPKRQRDRIAAVGRAFDDKIELNRRMNETLEGMARAIFKSWFVDFDPVRAKMDGRQPPGMDADTAALFPDRFDESKLGAIPKNWAVRSVRDVTDALFDGPHATPPKSDEGAVFLGIKNLTGTQIDLSEIRHISEKNWSKWTRRVTPQAGDIVFSYEATLGFFALIPPGLRCCLGRRLALVRPKKTASFEHVLFHTFTSAPFQQLLVERSVHGSTVDRIPLLQFPDFQILFPPEALRKRFEAFAASVWQRIHVNQEEIRSLASTRDALLPRLLSGKFDISACGESNAGSRTTVGGTRKR